MAKKNDTTFFENKLLDFVTAKDPLLEMLQWMMDKFMEIEVARKTGAPKGSHSQGRTGPYADELARSLHTLALVLGTDIFFRNGAYRPETEEGRKILAHELTHVAQSKKREEYRGASREELEREAEEAEEREVHDDDPIVEYSTGRNRYRMRESEARRIECMAERELAEWVEGQERAMPEEEYLKLLYKYREYLERKA